MSFLKFWIVFIVSSTLCYGELPPTLSENMSMKSELIDQIRQEHIESGPIRVILGNQSADMDSIVSAIVLSFSEGPHALALINIPKSELSLRKDVLYILEKLHLSPDYFLYRDDISELANEKIRITLVDHNALASSQEALIPYVDKIVDHHFDEKVDYPLLNGNVILGTVGSNSTLIGQMLLKDSPDLLTKEVSFLLLAPILLDTGNLNDPTKVTPLDKEVAEALMSRAGDLYQPDLYQILSDKKAEVDVDRPDLILKKDYKSYLEGHLSYGISSLPKGVEWNFNNQQEWSSAVQEFLNVEEIDLWIGLYHGDNESTLLFYTPNTTLLTALIEHMQSKDFLNQNFTFEGDLPESGLLMYRSQVKIARKVLQPALQFISSPYIQSAVP